MRRRVAVAAKRQDFSAHLMIHRKYFLGRCGICNSITVGRGIDLNALPVFNDLRKNFLHIMFHIVKRINALFIVS